MHYPHNWYIPPKRNNPWTYLRLVWYSPATVILSSSIRLLLPHWVLRDKWDSQASYVHTSFPIIGWKLLVILAQRRKSAEHSLQMSACAKPNAILYYHKQHRASSLPQHSPPTLTPVLPPLTLSLDLRLNTRMWIGGILAWRKELVGWGPNPHGYQLVIKYLSTRTGGCRG